MNFLAHLFLSFDDSDILVGNFIADMVKNREVPNYSDAVQKGITLHRKIDSFTDVHPKVKEGTKLLQPYHSKYSPVVVDIFYDYLLAKNWEKYSKETLDDFAQRTYKTLQSRIDEMPPKLKKSLPSMIAHDWLQGYSKEQGLRYTFERLKSRLSKPEQLENVVDNLFRHEKSLDDGFKIFFPEMIEYIKRIMDS